MTAASQASTLPLFYEGAVPLSSNDHAKWRLLPGDAAFAASAPVVPVTVSEFVSAGRFYPVVFSTGQVHPVVLTGLEQGNLFVRDGAWAEGAYVPAYVRRYPFVLIEAPDKSSYALGIDPKSPNLAPSGKEGRALFEDGKPTETVTQALEFCRMFNDDHARTMLFCEALTAANLLIDRRADATLPDGRKFGVEGFQVVDIEKLQTLDDATVVDWYRKGWLALIFHHLASLEAFGELLRRQGIKLTAGGKA